MLKIHHLVASRSDRIVWLAEELEIPYELVRHLRNPQTFRAPDSLRAITPLAKAPVIEDQGVVVSESSVICDYLIDQYGQGRLRPSAGTPARLDYAYWMASSESTLMAKYATSNSRRASLSRSDLHSAVQGSLNALTIHASTTACLPL